MTTRRVSFAVSIALLGLILIGVVVLSLTWRTSANDKVELAAPLPVALTAGDIGSGNAVGGLTLRADGDATLSMWEDASNADRSLAITGSHWMYGTILERPSANSAVTQYTAWNTMTYGSMLSPIRDYANSIPGSSGPFSEVSITYTWTETVTW